MPLYFAYGANMDVAAMAKRCPSSKPLGLARLPRGAAGIRRALVYIGRSGEPGRPRPGYLDDVIRAAEAAALPDAGIAAMRKFGEARPGIAAPATAAKAQRWV